MCHIREKGRGEEKQKMHAHRLVPGMHVCAWRAGNAETNQNQERERACCGGRAAGPRRGAACARAQTWSQFTRSCGDSACHGAPSLRARRAASVVVAAKAQHEPHWPWSRAGGHPVMLAFHEKARGRYGLASAASARAAAGARTAASTPAK